MTTKRTDRPDASAPEHQAVLDALRSNLSLLGELASRYQVETMPARPQHAPDVCSGEDVYALLAPEMAPLAQEQLRVLLLDNKNRVLGQRVVYQGNISAAIVRTAEVVRPAVIEAAPRMIVAHNHPSGIEDPSPEDVAVTRAIAQAARLLDIEVLDHVVIGAQGFASLKERGLM